jgi:hypothetical protein
MPHRPYLPRLLLAGASLLASLAPVGLRGGEVIGSADASFTIKDGATADKGDGGTDWKVADVTVVNVVNQKGNNPFMPENPIHNADGKLTGDDGDGGDAGGQYAKYKLSPDGQSGEATLLYDPAADVCELRSGPGGGDTRAIDIYMFPLETRTDARKPARKPPNGRGGARPWISISPAVMTSIWDGGGFWTAVTAGKTLSFTITHQTTGTSYLVTIKVDVVLTGGVTLVSIKHVGRR